MITTIHSKADRSHSSHCSASGCGIYATIARKQHWMKLTITIIQEISADRSTKATYVSLGRKLLPVSLQTFSSLDSLPPWILRFLMWIHLQCWADKGLYTANIVVSRSTLDHKSASQSTKLPGSQCYTHTHKCGPPSTIRPYWEVLHVSLILSMGP